jgi:hypothetical protein
VARRAFPVSTHGGTAPSVPSAFRWRHAPPPSPSALTSHLAPLATLPPVPASSHPQAAKAARIGAPLAAVGLGAGVAFSSGEDHVDPPAYAFEHKGAFKTFDAAA